MDNSIEVFRGIVEERLILDDPIWEGGVKATYGEDWRYDAIGLHFGLAKFVLRADDLVILCTDGELVIPRWRADTQLLAYQAGSTYFEHCERVDLIREGEEINFDYDVLRVVPRSEGQSKLFLSFVELLPGLEVSHDTNILCIGSSGDIGISGLSYEALVDILSGAGHAGTMYLYDPNYPSNQDYIYKSYRMVVRAEEYNYSLHGHRYHNIRLVYEDVYVGNMSVAKPSRNLGALVPVKNGRIPKGQSIFVVYRNSSGLLTLKAWKDEDRQSHKQHGLDMNPVSANSICGILGGGYMERTGNSLLVKGSSFTYGPYDPAVVLDLIPDLQVTVQPVMHGREAFDPSWSLYKAYSKARITSKYFGEKLPGWLTKYVISEQLMYRGHEKRLVYNTPRYVPKPRVCCEAHARLAGIGLSMKTKGNVHPSRLLDVAFASVTRQYCSPYVGIGALGIKQRLRAAAMQSMPLRDAVDHICVSLRVEASAVQRVLYNLMRYKELKIIRVATELFMQDFNECKSIDTVDGRRLVYVSDDGQSYYDPFDSEIKSFTGEYVVTPSHKKAYLIRGTARVRTSEYSLHDVMSCVLEFGLDWRSVQPAGLRGAGKYDVVVNHIGAPIILLSHAGGRDIKVPKRYANLGTAHGLRVFVDKSVKRSMKRGNLKVK